MARSVAATAKVGNTDMKISFVQKKPAKRMVSSTVPPSGKRIERPLKVDEEMLSVSVLANRIMQSDPGQRVVGMRRIPLGQLTKHASVAWQWKVGSKLHRPVPIGSSRPLSPFSSDRE
jgi:hypothetical protein